MPQSERTENASPRRPTRESRVALAVGSCCLPLAPKGQDITDITLSNFKSMSPNLAVMVRL